MIIRKCRSEAVEYAPALRCQKLQIHAVLVREHHVAVRFQDLELVGTVETRAIELYRTQGVERAGLVVIGDAYQTSCPATSFGVTRLLTDIHRLCAHLPVWLATPGMGPEKVATFYADPVKRSVDSEGLRRAYRDRSMAVSGNPFWRTYRLIHRIKGHALALVKRLRSGS